MQRRLPLVAVCVGTLLLIMDLTAVNTALPPIADDLHASYAQLQWVVDVYAVVLAATLLAAGTVADRLGLRRGYLAGMVVFAVASAVSGLAPSAGTLVAMRGVQAVGAAAMFTTTLSLLRTEYDGHERNVAFAVWGGVTGTAGALGPLVGGAITELASWRWVFLVNLPVVAVAVVVTLTSVTDVAGTRTRRLDLPGLVAFTGAAGGLSYGLIQGSAAALVAAAVLAAAFVLRQATAAEPMVEPGLLRDGRFSGGLVGGFALNFASYGWLAFAAVWLQHTLAEGPLLAGVVSGMPWAATSAVVSLTLGRRYAERPRTGVGAGLLLIGIGALGQAGVLGVVSQGWALVPGQLLAGAGMGLVAPCLSGAMTASVSSERTGMAAGSLGTSRQLGMSVAVAALGLVFALDHDPVVGLQWVLVGCAVVGLLGSASTWRLLGSSARHP